MYHRSQNASPRLSSGFTIVELMISITLGLVIVSSITQVLVRNKSLSKTEVSLSRIQESGRFVINTLAEDLRNVGYHGCTDPSKMKLTVMARTGIDADFGATSLRGFEVGTDGDFEPAIVSGDALANIQGAGALKARQGSDVVQLKYADRTGAKLTAPTDVINASLSVDSNTAGLATGDYALVADCQSAHLFEITNVSTTSGITTLQHATADNNPHQITPGYNADSDLLAFRDITYFVADTGRKKNGTTSVYALYRKRHTSATPEELVEGVEFLQVLYGEQVGSNIRFVPAGTSGLNMQAVTAIKIGILIQDFDVSVPENDTVTYSLLNASIPPTGTVSHNSGRTLRKAFSATVQLRNTRM